MIAFLLLCTTTIDHVNANLNPYDMADTTVMIRYENEKDYTKLISEKAYITFTKTSNSESSKISVKGIACKTKIRASQFFNVYFRIRNDIRSIQFCMFKMNIKGNKRVASSHSVTGNKIEKVATSCSALDETKKIYSMQIVSTLVPGIYGFAFVNISHKGHFYYNTFVSKSVYCIEITE